MAPSDATEKNRKIMHNYCPSCIQLLKEVGKFTSCMNFGAHTLVHSEPFLDYPYEIWQLPSALCSDVRKKIYVHIYSLGPKLLQWNFFLQILQQSIRSGAHKLCRRFLDFPQFVSAISRKLWHHLATNSERAIPCEKKTVNRVKIGQ